MSAVSFAYVAHRLGIADRSAVYRSRYVHNLIEQHSFPRPLPYFAWRPSSLRWDVRAVDHWLDSRIEDDAADRVDISTERAAADLMDARAERISA